VRDERNIKVVSKLAVEWLKLLAYESYRVGAQALVINVHFDLHAKQAHIMQRLEQLIKIDSYLHHACYANVYC
jgi:hypothetical protein